MRKRWWQRTTAQDESWGQKVGLQRGEHYGAIVSEDGGEGLTTWMSVSPISAPEALVPTWGWISVSLCWDLEGKESWDQSPGGPG